MKNILLLVHDDDGQEARVQAALDLTRAVQGHLRCVDVALQPVLMGDYFTGAGEAMLVADECARESRNKAALEARLAKEDVAWDWIDVTGTFADAICDAAALADIVVLNRKLDGAPYPDMRDAASRILTGVRVPVVAVPDRLRELRLGRALVAWDGQRSAAATLRACTPLLRLADAVEIFTVRDGRLQTEPSEAASYLSRYGIHARVRIVEDGLHPADRSIAAECDRFRADYVLMGAYSHGRLRETFGGVTKRMLGTAKLPLILCH